jgi:hypothetical protein
VKAPAPKPEALQDQDPDLDSREEGPYDEWDPVTYDACDRDRYYDCKERDPPVYAFCKRDSEPAASKRDPDLYPADPDLYPADPDLYPADPVPAVD